MRVFAHRGLSARYPENTLEAFEAAARAGASWLEFDVDVTADGVAVIIHDDDVARTTSGSGDVNELTSEYIRGLDAGEWKGMPGAKVPTLAETVELMNRLGLSANVELKGPRAGVAACQRQIEEVGKALAAVDPRCELIVSSFNHLLLDRFHQAFPQYPIGLLWEVVPEDWKSCAEIAGASAIHPGVKGLRAEQVRAMRDAGYDVNVWTVNDIDIARQLRDAGATGIFTDGVDEMLGVL